jgi:hypothetical protein
MHLATLRRGPNAKEIQYRTVTSSYTTALAREREAGDEPSFST